MDLLKTIGFIQDHVLSILILKGGVDDIKTGEFVAVCEVSAAASTQMSLTYNILETLSKYTRGKLHIEIYVGSKHIMNIQPTFRDDGTVSDKSCKAVKNQISLELGLDYDKIVVDKEPVQ